ncbi:MAG: MBL fold metallo-hydrolase, partial [Patescibacteria group bacterium]
NSQFSISGPGEYNIKDVNITGFALPKESSEKFLKTVYLIKMEGINLCFLGHISETPEPAILEHLEEIDILFIPAGGEPFINQKSAAKTVKQTEPKIVIPSFYKIPGLKRTAGDISAFLEEFNGEKTKQKETQEKLVVKKKDLAGIKKTEIIILKP